MCSGNDLQTGNDGGEKVKPRNVSAGHVRLTPFLSGSSGDQAVQTKLTAEERRRISAHKSELLRGMHPKLADSKRPHISDSVRSTSVKGGETSAEHLRLIRYRNEAENRPGGEGRLTQAEMQRIKQGVSLTHHDARLHGRSGNKVTAYNRGGTATAKASFGRVDPNIPELGAEAMDGPGWVEELDPNKAAETSAPEVDLSAPLVAPSWETRQQARIVSIPGVRGDILDRKDQPLATTVVHMNLAVDFSSQEKLPAATAVVYAKTLIAKAGQLLKRHLIIADKEIARHYQENRILPLDIAKNLTQTEKATINAAGVNGLMLHPTYERVYPYGSMAAHVLGYLSRTDRPLRMPKEAANLLWAESEGKDGLEQTFDKELAGKLGKVVYDTNAEGNKAQKMIAAPETGATVVTTLDLELQKLCDKELAAGRARGAMVIVDPANGDILAMSSFPTFDPNVFAAGISQKQFKALNENPSLPMLPRAFRAAYPPGSTFKVFLGISALESGSISLDDMLDAPAAMRIGGCVMHSCAKRDLGPLTFSQALEYSCNTWFFQAGLRTGAKPIVDWAVKFGFGEKTGIPLQSEASGSVPTDAYLASRHLPPLGSVGIANISIGQGDLLITPLQMAEAMAAIGNGGILYQTRLVREVRDANGQVVTDYKPKAKAQLPFTQQNWDELKEAMVAVITTKLTTGVAPIPGIDVAAKTGTAEWGPKGKGRTAAWFAGFAPANNPKYAFAIIYECDGGGHGGVVAAPVAMQVLRQAFKEKPAGVACAEHLQ